MSDDPLTRVEPGPPCPSCGSRVSLRALQRVRDKLRRKKAEQGGRTVWGQRKLQVGGGGGGGGGRGGGAIVLDVKGGINAAPGSQISAGSGRVGGIGGQGQTALGDLNALHGQPPVFGNAVASPRVPSMPVGGGGWGGNVGPSIQASGGSGGSGASGDLMDGGLGLDHTSLDHVSASGPVQIDGEICARCGTFWKPDARQEAIGVEEEIRNLRLETESAVDLLGRVSDDG